MTTLFKQAPKWMTVYTNRLALNRFSIALRNKWSFDAIHIGQLILVLGMFLVQTERASAQPKADTSSMKDKETVSLWKKTAKLGFHFNQLSLSNWASGGESSASGKINTDLKAVYKKKNFQFESNSKMAFGIVGYGDHRLEKTDDRIDFSTSFSYKAYQNWTYTTVLSFKSQFANGYKYPNDSVIISGFLAPAYINASLGYRYKKSDVFEVFLSPASGKFTIVNNQSLADKGAFGVKPAIRDTSGMVVSEGSRLLCEFGINLLANLSKEITENIELSSTLNLYNNYLDDNFDNRWNIDVDWETTLNFVINKRIQTMLFLQLKYDHDFKVPVYQLIDNDKVQVGEGPRLQFKESMGIGITYNLI